MVDQIQLKTAEERGVQQGVQRTLLRQLTGRIGEVPQEIVGKLQSLSTDQLDEFSDALFNLNTYDDVAKWFTRH